MNTAYSAREFQGMSFQDASFSKDKDTNTISFTVPNNPKIRGMTVGFVFGVKQQTGSNYAISVTIYNEAR